MSRSPRPYPPPSLLPPARYQIEPHLRYEFLTPRNPPSRSTWRRQRAQLRLAYLRTWQRLLDRLGGLPRERPQGPEVAALQLLIVGLLAIVLFQALLLVLVAR